MGTFFRYERVDNGEAVELPELEVEIEHLWPNHQSYISNIMIGLEFKEWTIRFVPGADRAKGSGCLFKGINVIAIVTNTKSEMLTTLLHEILHLRNPSVPEKEIETRCIDWYKTLKFNGE